MGKIYQLNKFGKEVAHFCVDAELTKKDIARMACVKYSTLTDATIGRCAGHELIPTVRAFMDAYRKAHFKQNS